MKKVLLATLVTLAAAFPATAQADFGRLFPNLPPIAPHSDLDYADLAQVMLDPNAVSENNCTDTTPLAGVGCSFSIMTYAGGQFIDHDITLDRTPSPTTDIDPVGLTNFRTFKLDLDSVYGGGPTGSPQLYAADGLHFLLQEPNPNGVRDLPRRADGSAILEETRNDENQIIAQFHTAILKAHNRLIDEGLSFTDARSTLVRHYQAAVVDELQAHTISPSLGDPILNHNPEVFRLAARMLNGMTPIEFSTAAFRYGHSNVRLAYRLNGTNNCQNLQVFDDRAAPQDQTALDLRGGRQLQAGRQINWGMFTDEFPKPAGCENNDRNIQRKFDALISASLFRLPNPFVADRSNMLGFLNMVRAGHYGIPSGESVASALGLPVLTADELGLPADLAARFSSGTPLWFYILRESSVRENGQRLGPVGSYIVASSFVAILMRDRSSILRVPFTPRSDIAGADGRMTLGDLISFAGVVS